MASNDTFDDQSLVGSSVIIEEEMTICGVYEFLISVVLMGPSLLLGYLGNIISIVILKRDPRTSVTLFLLIALAVVDFLFLVPMTFLFVVPGTCNFLFQCPTAVVDAQPWINKYGWAVASMAHTGTVYMTVLVTFHRYISVCRPHDASKISTISKAKHQVFIISLFAIIFNLPRFFEFDVVPVIHKFPNGQEEVRPKRMFTSFGGSSWYQIGYKNITFYLIMYIIPLTTLLILSHKLLRTIRRRRKYRLRVFLKRNPREDNTTFVLIIIVIVFIICQTPTPFQRLFYTVFGNAGRACGHFFFYFEKFSDYLAVLNSCVNFMVYVIFAKGFRQSLTTTICRRRKSHFIFRL